MPRVNFDSFTVEASAGWSDITATVEPDDPPFTLAHQEGVGALQFSVTLYQSGPIPNPTPAALQVMVEEFGHKHGLGEPFESVVEPGPPRLAAASFDWG